MLEQILSTDIYRFVLVVARIGSVVMLMPGLGAQYVLPQARLFLGLSLSFLVLPLVTPLLPALPRTTLGLFLTIVSEVTIGVFMGLMLQILLVSIHSAATMISFVSGFANSMVFDPVSEEQSAVIVGFLGNIAVMAIFAAGLHHLVFQAAVDSYTLFRPGHPLLVGDLSQVALKTLDQGFVLGAQMAAPFLVASVVFQVGLGVIARLMPQMNAFFVGLPAQLLLGLALFMVVIPPMTIAFLNFFRDGIAGYVAPG
ncbi:MAG: flagellar biosynthetic protein FliR [Alphaproteobacteria bacterium]